MENFYQSRVEKCFKTILILFILFLSNQTSGQTKGLIVEPSSGGGAVVLDPNGDGYVSVNNTGFVGDDSTESEIPYVPFVFPGLEPTSDISNGPNCGFTDFVDSGGVDPALSYVDASGNWLFRLRLGDIRNNAKSYSILVDTDGLFGNSGISADPDYTLDNPGFEVEIVLGTKFGVYMYNVDGVPNCTPVVQYLGNDHYQKSIAHSEVCSDPDYFLDFYVDSSDLTSLGITNSTSIRMVIVDNMAATASTVCQPSSASDIAGVGDCDNLAECYEEIIDNQGPCSLADINAGLCLAKSACPQITGPIDDGDTVVLGSTTESDGTLIRVYNNGVLIGSTNSSAGGWSLTGISPAVSSNDIITATAQATGKSESDSDCSSTTVGVTCSAPPTSAIHCGKSISGLAPVPGAVINIYFNDSSTPLTPTSGTEYAAGEITVSASAHGANGTDNFLWKCVGSGASTQCNASGPACLPDGVYRITATEPGKCESTPIYVCIGTSGDTATPTITTSPISTATTTISGSMPSPDNVASDISVMLFVNDIQVGNTTTTSGGAWSVNGLTLNACDAITVSAIRTGGTPKCVSPVSAPVSVLGDTSDTPQISGSYCTTGTITTVNGISGEDDGTTISVFENGVLEGTTTVSSGAWTLSSISISPGSTITATATASGTCKTESSVSSGVVVSTQTTNSVSITTSPVVEQSTSITGTGTDNDVVTLYVDGFLVDGLSATVSGGIWTISGIPDYVFYIGAEVTVKATTPGLCESAPSASTIVDCIPPTSSLVVNPDNQSICSGSSIEVEVESSENLTIYQLFLGDGVTPTGASVLGTGGTITLSSGPLSGSTSLTLRVKAIKLPVGTCEVFLSDTVSVTVNDIPDLSLTVGDSDNPICEGTSTNITIALSEIGVSYQLRDDSDDSNIGSPVAGTGGTINLPTGNLNSDTTFNILATSSGGGSCFGQMDTTVTINVTVQPNAGTNGTLTVCAGTTPTDAELFAELGGSPDTGGSWSNVGLVYTYTVSGAMGCPDSTAEVFLIIDLNDTDGDGVIDCNEVNPSGGDLPTDPTDACDYNIGDVSVPITSGADCDGDGVTDQEEIDPNNDGDTSDQVTDPRNDCSFDSNSITEVVTSMGDCDGDGVTNTDEANDGTDPQDDCSFNSSSITQVVTSMGDCDGDGVPNSDEINDGTDPQDPCDYIITSITLVITSGIDCDGDGVIDSDEILDGTDPKKPCVFVPSSRTLPVQASNPQCNSNLEVIKTASTPFGSNLGDTIEYTITVENTGESTIMDIMLEDTFTDVIGNTLILTEPLAFDGADRGSPIGVLLPGEIATYLASFIITQEAVNAGGVQNTVTATGVDPDGDIVTDVSDDGDDLDGNTEDDFTVTELGCLLIFNEFSPNGDGVNDYLIINCIENYPNNELKIYNRWGNLVYKKRHYMNDWDGTSKGRSTIKVEEKLPVGTYYYVLDYGNGAKPKVGWIYLNR